MEQKNHHLPSREIVEKTAKALKENGINVYITHDRNEANKKVFELIPQGVEIMTMTSVTLDELGIANEINESDRYDSVRKKLMNMDRKKQGQEMQKIGAAPEWVIGSVNAVTQDGKLIIASNSGSQIPAYAYGAGNVIWVVGTQKVVKDLDEGFKRIYDYVLPLESERAKKAYGVPGSFVSKILIINRDINNKRIHLIFVPEKLGF